MLGVLFSLKSGVGFPSAPLNRKSLNKFHILQEEDPEG